jgi:hypothetical protein
MPSPLVSVAKLPTPEDFAWTAFVQALNVSRQWKDEERAASEIFFTLTHSTDAYEYRTWIWNRNGRGDSVRVSSERYGRRLCVNFDHESERSPWGDNNDELPSGLDWLGPINARAIRASDDLNAAGGTLSVTEVYEHVRPSKLETLLGESDGVSFWRTSQTIADLDQNFLALGGGLEEIEIDKDMSASYASALCEEREQLRPFQDLYLGYMAGEPASLARLVELTGNDRVGATAYVVASGIADWLKPSDDY